MRVLMTADTVGGVWTYALTLCQALHAKGVTVALATMGRRLSPIQQQQVRQLHNVTLYESAYRLCWMADAEQDVAAAGRWLIQLEEEIKPDVVHLNDLGHGNLPWRAPMLLVAHSCVFSWWQAVYKRKPPSEDWRDYHALVSAGITNAQLVAAPTAAMLEALLEQYRRVDAKIPTAVIANGRDFPELAARPSNDDQKQPLLFGAGRIWDEAKNLALVSKVAEQLPWPVYLAGEQSDPNGGTCDHAGITLLGFLAETEIAQWLQKAAIYVAPAKYEPFGLAILEAARAGCALVLGDVPSLREVWGDAAVYVDTDSPASLRTAICSLIDDPNRRHHMAQAAWHRAQTYTAGRMADTYCGHYQALMNKHSAAQPTPAKAIAGAQQ